VDGTKQLVQLVSKLQHPPKLFLSASAIGYYGSRDEPVTEESVPGNGFLSRLCKEWEEAAEGLKSRGIRVALARFGYVLSPKGGILHSLLPLFRLGLGMTIASGNQKMSWVSLEDTVEALYHILMQEEIQGAVNITSPHPVSQKVFAKTLAKALARPCVLSLPRAFLIGEKAKELLLPSLEAIPNQLQGHGFVFSYPHLDEYLHFCLK
jgi:uncharacterized protein (TIGR01777 family)